jgi:tetraacyldisaccharide 4'-kinase
MGGGAGEAPAGLPGSSEDEQAQGTEKRDANVRKHYVPVISVGNITTGGTGKTPMVVWVIEHLRRAERRPAILTRGYKSHEGVSDEAQLLRAQAGVPVIVNPDRVAGAREAIAGGANVLVMDDGFQHRRLRRDLDIVLIDASNPFGYGFCLPRGLMREPATALRDAHAIVITHSDAVFDEDLSALRASLIRLSPRASISTAMHKPTCLVDARGKKHSFKSLAGKSVFAFCGIGSPHSFFESLEVLGADVVATQAMEDHVHYGPETVESLKKSLSENKADFAVTTQKDMVKLSKVDLGKPILALAVAMEILTGEDELALKIVHCVARPVR